MTKRKGKIIIPVGKAPWAHEMRVAEILAAVGHVVEFLPERTVKTADILLDGVEFEDGRKMPEAKVKSFLLLKCKQHPQIKRMLLITKAKHIIDIMELE